MRILGLERWNAASPHLDLVLESDEASREALLAALERDDPAVAADVRVLLASHRELLERRFLDQGPHLPADLLVTAGQDIGPYQLLSPLGEGGMGTVWLAERHDGRFERRVAIKLLKVGLLGRPSANRFMREGALLAQLRHPHIAGLIDAGLLPSDRPYLVLEYVDGEPIDHYCDRHQLGVEERIRLFLDVASAVEHAHAHLVVHRDIKPGNVLVAHSGEVKLLDFGIAKLLDAEGRPPAVTRTRDGGAAMTPEYAAPEQLTGAMVSTGTDVYSLGVLLYLLLAGRHPAGEMVQTPAGLMRAIIDTVPPPVSVAATTRTDEEARVAALRSSSPERLRRHLQGDLDIILAAALKKEPAERYASVGAFAADLRRFLAHEPITARPDSLAYRARKFVQRNRGVSIASVLAAVAIVAGVAATMTQASVARAQRDFAVAQLERADALNDLNNYLLVDAAPGGKPFTVLELLQRAERVVQQQKIGGTTRANLLIGIGGQYGTMEAIDESRRVLEEAYRTSRQSSEPAVRANAACSLAEALVLAGDSARARRLVQEGLAELPSDPEFELERASCLLKGSRIAREAGSADEAITLARAAVAARERSPFRSSFVDLRAAIDLAESYSQAGRNVEANAAFGQASKQLEVLGRADTLTAGTVYNNWALSLGLLGRPLDAVPLFVRAIDISRDGDTDHGVAPMLLLNYARVLREIGRLDLADVTLAEAQERARSTGHEVVVNQALLQRATLNRELGRLEQADAALDEVEPRLRQALPPGHFAFASLAGERAQLELAHGNGERAIELINEAVAIAEAAGRTFAVNRARVDRAEILLEIGEHGLAESEATAVLALLQAGAPPDLRTSYVGRAHLARGRALAAVGRSAEAAADYAAALQNLDSAVGPEQSATQVARALVKAAEAG